MSRFDDREGVAKARHDFEIEVARIEQSRKVSEAHKARLKERKLKRVMHDTMRLLIQSRS